MDDCIIVGVLCFVFGVIVGIGYIFYRIRKVYNHDITVDWGDTTTNQFTSFDTPNIIHTYSTHGDYKITIKEGKDYEQ